MVAATSPMAKPLWHWQLAFSRMQTLPTTYSRELAENRQEDQIWQAEIRQSASVDPKVGDPAHIWQFYPSGFSVAS